jgi:pentose-5-phosphate-3-epimerase
MNAEKARKIYSKSTNEQSRRNLVKYHLNSIFRKIKNKAKNGQLYLHYDIPLSDFSNNEILFEQVIDNIRSQLSMLGYNVPYLVHYEKNRHEQMPKKIIAKSLHINWDTK